MNFSLKNYLIIYLNIQLLFSSSNQSIDEQLYECVCLEDSPLNLNHAINKSSIYLKERMSQYLLPGLVVGVSREGQTVWEDAFGWADIENDVPTQTYSVFRVASISKMLTSALVGHLIDEGLVDLHESIHKYLSPNVFPIKQWKGKNVTITLDQLMSHSAGLRVEKEPDDFQEVFYFKNVTDSLNQYKDEPLISEPGTQYNYSNYGFVVVGAIVESVLKESFDKSIDKMFKHLKMNSTFCELNQMVVKHRVRDYTSSNSPFLPKNNNNNYNESEIKLLNEMFLDQLLASEAQWPTGAMMSTSSDLLTFGNYLLNRYKASENDTYFDFLSPNTVKKIWSPVIEKYKNDFGSNKNAHGCALTILDKPIECTGNCKLPSKIKKVVWKAGQLTGVSTVLLILPDQQLIVTLLSNNSDFDNIFEAALIIAKNFMN